uniref:ras association domain-containing protein 8-like n=1 Tax=Semicossyphus pulcher TaxID=241346 RepID=UPI0037E86595
MMQDFRPQRVSVFNSQQGGEGSHQSLDPIACWNRVMELKVWLEGVVRVVDAGVVVGLKLLAQLGQQAAEVQLILRRTGPSLSDGRDTPTREAHPLPRPSEPEPLKGRTKPHKALTFNLGPSTSPRRMKSNRAWSPSPRASPEPRASLVSLLDPFNTVNALPSSSSKEEVFRQILQQQKRLEDLEIQLQAPERETDVWERDRSSAGLNPVPAGELEELEQRLTQNQTELMNREHWERQLQDEINTERGMSSHLVSTEALKVKTAQQWMRWRSWRGSSC